MQFIGKTFIIFGIALIIIGIAFYKIPIGKLPGDILIKRDGFTFYFPITTTILISVILNILIAIIKKIL
ncbi:DUF2905 domain-containing protein [Marinitoga litoralis]|jgi:hypothetical protein|uniref:DUF2905 domain-containing protein n=1 Tax=Marinitoga litoralis TaxID=570855 RepID=UPI001960F1F7|nr:DUF2905 domain-containing protein [Marinitoga litoralis]MBM7559880.1 hypothetical protein [Marinitoga litoralis]